MNHVSISVPTGDAVVSSIEDLHEDFAQANDFLRSTNRESAFQIELVGLT